MKIKKIKTFFFWGGVGLGGGGGVQGESEWRSEAFVKIQKKNSIFFFSWGGGWGVGSGGDGLGGWEWRIEAFVKIQKKKYFFLFGGGGGGVGRVRVDVNREVKFLSKSKKKVEGGGSDQGLGWGGG